METHSHELHKAPGNGLKHYFFEFFMLFLAVFCGFLAENIREYAVEKKRGEQYIMSFSEDLKKDTMQCDHSINELTFQLTVLKNMTACFNILKANINSTDCLKEIIIYTSGFRDFIYRDGTIQQLKNAGGMRLIEDKEISDGIIAYDALVREMEINQAVLENLQQICINAHNNMIDFVHKDELIISKQTNGLFLLSTDPAALNKYFNAMTSFRAGLYAQLEWVNEIKDKATALLNLLDKKGYK